MSAALVLTVRADPAPQGSKRAFAGRRKDGTTYAGMVESSHYRVQSWRQAVVDAGLAVMAGGPPLEGPLRVAVTFSLARPKGHYGTGRNARQLKPSAPRFPDGTPDLSKILRSTEDALTSAGVWRDDAQVVEYTRAAKVYAEPYLGLHGTATLTRLDPALLSGITDADVLPVPAVIRVTALTAQLPEPGGLFRPEEETIRG